jgi:Mg2+ and Co2+ transporter CorA
LCRHDCGLRSEDLSVKTVRERYESCPRALARGEDYIFYDILNFIVDNYSPVLEAIQEEVEAMEAQVLASAMTRAQIERLYLLRTRQDNRGRANRRVSKTIGSVPSRRN